VAGDARVSVATPGTGIVRGLVELDGDTSERVIEPTHGIPEEAEAGDQLGRRCYASPSDRCANSRHHS